jgi:galactofuranose transport system substrate-binding protein
MVERLRVARAPGWGRRFVLALAVGVLMAFAGACGGADDDSDSSATAGSDGAEVTAETIDMEDLGPGREGMELLLDYDEQDVEPKKSYRIGYLAECANDPYCAARLQGMEDAAEKYGATFKTFDAGYSPATQLKHVQTAVADNSFDGFVFAPTARAPACAMYNQYLKPTGKPVVTVDIPMCEDADVHPGTAGAVLMQTQDWYDRNPEYAFASCKGEPCEVVAIGGFVGSDLFTQFQNGLKKAQANHPNVELVVNQAADFDPRKAFQVVQDALRAHPDVSVIASQWDDMTRGALQAVQASGKVPGKDIRIYTAGGTRDALNKIKAGLYEETLLVLPYEESYYGMVGMIRKLETGEDFGFANEAYAPSILDGPGTIFITKENADKFDPKL